MHTIVELKQLRKVFKVVNRRSGFKGACLDIFARNYREIEAVKGISLEIEGGEIIGFLGPNGAGKSTTIKMMTGILQPSGGEILLAGRNPCKNRIQTNQQIGVVFGQRSQLWWNLPLIESYEILKNIYQIDQKEYEKRLAYFSELVPLEPLLKKTVRQMSLGQRMLGDIVAAFLHQPSIVFLDEPTIGLDIHVKNQIRHLIREVNKTQQTTIILTSHDIGDIEALCNRVVVIDHGELIFDDSIHKLSKMFGSYKRISLYLDQVASMEEVKSYLQILYSEIEESDILIEENWIHITIDESKVNSIDLLALFQKEYKIADILIEGMKVESVIHKIYAGGIHEKTIGHY